METHLLAALQLFPVTPAIARQARLSVSYLCSGRPTSSVRKVSLLISILA